MTFAEFISIPIFSLILAYISGLLTRGFISLMPNIKKGRQWI
jgi:hypothetical protein